MRHVAAISKMKCVPACAFDYRDVQSLLGFLSQLVGLFNGILSLFTGVRMLAKSPKNST